MRSGLSKYLQLPSEFPEPIDGFETLIVWKGSGGPYLVVEQVRFNDLQAAVVFVNGAVAYPIGPIPAGWRHSYARTTTSPMP